MMPITFCKIVLSFNLFLVILNISHGIRNGKAIEVNKKELSELLRKIKLGKVEELENKVKNLSEPSFYNSSTILNEEQNATTRIQSSITIHEKMATRSIIKLNESRNLDKNIHEKILIKKKTLNHSTVNPSNVFSISTNKGAESEYFKKYRSDKAIYNNNTLTTNIVKDVAHMNVQNTKSIHRFTPYPSILDTTNHRTQNAKRPIRPTSKCSNPSDPPFQLWCIEAKVNDAAASATDADVVLELSLEDGTTCTTDSLNSWKDDFEAGATEKFCGRGILGLTGHLGDCLDKIISCDFEVSIRLIATMFVSVKARDLQLDWVKVSNQKGNLFHINNRSTTFYNELEGKISRKASYSGNAS